MIKQSLTIILAALLSGGCANSGFNLSSLLSGTVNSKYNDGLTMIDQGRILEKGIIHSNGDEFTLPIPPFPNIDTVINGEGVYFTMENGELERTYVVSGSSDEIRKLSDNLDRAKKVTFEFLPSGEYVQLSKNRGYYSNALPRKNCQFTFTLENCAR